MTGALHHKTKKMNIHTSLTRISFQTPKQKMLNPDTAYNVPHPNALMARELPLSGSSLEGIIP